MRNGLQTCCGHVVSRGRPRDTFSESWMRCHGLMQLKTARGLPLLHKSKNRSRTAHRIERFFDSEARQGTTERQLLAFQQNAWNNEPLKSRRAFEYSQAIFSPSRVASPRCSK